MDNQPLANQPPYPQHSSGQYPPQRYDGPPQGYPQQPSGQYPPQQYPQQPSGQYPPQQYPQQPSGQYPPQQYPQQPSGQYPPQQYPPQRYDGPPQGYPQTPQGFPQAPQTPRKRGRGPLIAVGIIVGILLLACIGVGVVAASYIGKAASITKSVNVVTTSGVTNNGTTPTAVSTQASNHKVGDVVQVGTDWTAAVDSVKTSTGSTYSTPKTGMKYLIISLTMKNLSAETQTVSSIVQFTLRGSDGTKYDVTIFPDAGSVIDGSVNAGQPAKGVIVYEVPTNMNTFQLTFSNNPYDATASQATWDLSV